MGWVVLVLLVLRSFVCLFYLYKYINNKKYSAGTLRWGCIYLIMGLGGVG